MNYSDRFLRETASYSVLDIMLADIAVRIQLTPTDYQKAIDHYEAINEWIDREDSPLHGRVQLFYPQGGFMIGATTARHASDADFDIDVMAQVGLRPCRTSSKLRYQVTLQNPPSITGRTLD
jgi:hypothetical protein